MIEQYDGVEPPLSTSFNRLPLSDAQLHYQASAVTHEQADAWLQALMALPWQQRAIQMYGRRIMQPRLTVWYGDPGAVYTYSKTRHEPLPWCPPLLEIRSFLQQQCGAIFNSVLGNLYRDGADGMGWHSDNEPELGERPVIASLSLGMARRFVLRRKNNPKEKYALVLEHGSLLVMAGHTQRHWQHALPKTSKTCAPRINLTYRYILPAP